MYMHLTFHDGSNPYVTFNKSGEQIKAIYRRWSNENKMPLEMIARIDVYSAAVDGLRIYTNGGHGFRVAWKDNNRIEHFLPKTYFRFAHAVNAMGRMSEKLQKEKG